jgi:hypothetical protein
MNQARHTILMLGGFLCFLSFLGTAMAWQPEWSLATASTVLLATLLASFSFALLALVVFHRVLLMIVPAETKAVCAVVSLQLLPQLHPPGPLLPLAAQPVPLVAPGALNPLQIGDGAV